MKEYKDLYTEEIEKASCCRSAYLASVLSVAEKKAEEMKAKRESYVSPETLRRNRTKYLADFKDILGDPMFNRGDKQDVKKNLLGIDGQGYVYRLEFTFEKNISFCGLLFVPFDAKGKLPLVVALHGGEGTPELMSDVYGSNYYSHITRRLLDKRVVVFAPQLLLWDGKRFGNSFDRFELDARFKMLGSSLTAFECECISGAIDILSNESVVDADRIGITGLSYGGYYSIVVAALDERIKAVYSSCAFNDRVRYSRPDFTYRTMANRFLDAETASLIYPRALYIEAGKHDGIFNVDGAKKEYERLRLYYEDMPEKFIFSVHEGGHEYDLSDSGIDFLINNL